MAYNINELESEDDKKFCKNCGDEIKPRCSCNDTKKKKKKSTGNDGGCCGCLLGLGLGYLLWHGHAQGAELVQIKPTHPESIEQTVIDQENNSLLKLIGHYQREVSPRLHAELGKEQICKYEPSCSEYAREAIIKHGKVKGSVKAMGRLARCNPLSKGRYDPV